MTCTSLHQLAGPQAAARRDRAAPQAPPGRAVQKYGHSGRGLGSASFVARAGKERVVVVGGGNAAGYFCKRMVEARDSGEEIPEITVVSTEMQPPYERPALTKAYLHKEDPARLPGFFTSVATGGPLQTADWYAANGIELALGEYVVNADFEKQTVTTGAIAETAQAREIPYDKLVIATGVRARQLPDDMGGHLPGVHYIRSEIDAQQLVKALPDSTRAVVIGGGYIGVELSAALAAWGIPITMVFPEDNIMPRLFNGEIAKPYEDLFKSKGVTMLKGKEVWYLSAGYLGDYGQVTSVVLSDGEVLECDLVIIGIGCDVGAGTLGPFRSLADCESGGVGGQGIDPMRLAYLENATGVGGIPVDHTFRVASPEARDKVWAIGDVAAFPLKLDNDAMFRVEHVDHARRSGELAAADIIGLSPAPYDYMPYFYSRVFEQKDSTRPVHWVFYGLQKGEITTVGDFKPSMAAFWVLDDKVVGLFLESGSPEEVAALPELARKQPRVDVQALKAAKSASEALAIVRGVAVGVM